MPIISAFLGIVIRIHYNDHNPPHLHAEYQGSRSVFDFNTDFHYQLIWYPFHDTEA